MFVDVSVKDKFDSWFDSYVIDHEGQISLSQFCSDVCECYDEMGPLDLVTIFNRLQETTDVNSYQKKFEDLHCRLLVVRPHAFPVILAMGYVGGANNYPQYIL